jgi:hypothetical protein
MIGKFTPFFGLLTLSITKGILGPLINIPDPLRMPLKAVPVLVAGTSPPAAGH